MGGGERVPHAAMPWAVDNGPIANGYRHDAAVVGGSTMNGTGKALQASVSMSFEPRCSRGSMPDIKEVTHAVQSLYDDLLKPYGRILRKRLAERATEHESGMVDVDIRRLKSLCESCPWLSVQTEDGGDWSALLRNRQMHMTDVFVDVYSPTDIYPAELWGAVAHYFEHVAEPEMVLPGGRYSCAQALRNRNLPFLAQYRLGQVCHIVQLAISQKKILGYLNGAVVPYKRSQSMVKERCAEKQRPCANAARGTTELATWDSARSGLREILSGCAGSVPLSNIKRLFRSRFRIELSETALGHAKLSELLQDERLRDVCEVRLQGHGYVVVPLSTAALPVGMQQRSAPPQRAPMPGPMQVPSGKPISLSDKLMPYFDARRGNALDETQSSYNMSGMQAAAQLAVPHVRTNAPAPPLLTPATNYSTEILAGTTLHHGHMEGAYTQPAPPPEAAAAVLAGHGMVSFASPPVQAASPEFSHWQMAGAVSEEGWGGVNVHNTFIHTKPPLSPPPGVRRTRRARSLPKDLGSDKSPEDTFCASMNYASRQTDDEGESDEVASPEGGVGEVIGEPMPAGPISAERLDSTLTFPHSEQAADDAAESNEAMVSGLAARRQFRPNPVNLEQVQRRKPSDPEYVIPSPELSPLRPRSGAFGRGSGNAMPALGGMFGKPPPPEDDAMQPMWSGTAPHAAVSSTPAYLDSGMMVRNTFINVVTQPDSPAPCTGVRAHSLPRNMGSSEAAMSLASALRSAGIDEGMQDGGNEFYRGRSSEENEEYPYEVVTGPPSLAATPSPQRSPSPRRPSLPARMPPKGLLPEALLLQRPNMLPPQRVVRLADLV